MFFQKDVNVFWKRNFSTYSKKNRIFPMSLCSLALLTYSFEGVIYAFKSNNLKDGHKGSN